MPSWNVSALRVAVVERTSTEPSRRICKALVPLDHDVLARLRKVLAISQPSAPVSLSESVNSRRLPLVGPVTVTK